MAWEDDLARSIENLNRNISRAFGGSTDSFLGSRAAGAGGGTSGTTGFNHMNALKTSVSATTASMRLMHGNVDDLNHLFRRFVKFGVVSEVFDLITEAGRNLVQSYNKMTNIGQNFGGSMFAMAQAAGASGLSLDEFTKAMERNSITAALMQTHGMGTNSAFMDLQKGVRSNLKDMGFYGMTLTQITDATGDFMDSIRESGNLNKLDSDAQKKYVTEMITAATGFSAAFGKNRDQLLKDAKEAVKNPTALAMLTEPGQIKAFQQSSIALAALGDAGKLTADTLSKVIGSLGGSTDTTIELIGQFNKVGMQGTAQAFDALKARVMNKETLSAADVTNFNQSIIQSVEANRENLLRQAAFNGPNADAARAILKYAQELQGMGNTADVVKRFNDALKPPTALTAMANTFESTFHEMTGSFREGFYKILGGDDAPLTDQWKKTLDDTSNALKESMKKLGISFGSLFGGALTPDKIANFTLGVDGFIKFVAETLPYLFDGLKTAFGWIMGAFRGARDFIQNTFGLSEGKANAVTLAIGYGLWKFLSNFLSGFIMNNGIFYIRNAVGLGGGGIGAPGAAGAGAPGATTAARPGLRQSWQSGGFRGLVGNMFGRAFGAGGTFRSLGGMFMGAITGVLAGGLIEYFGSKIGLPDTATNILATVGGLFATMFGPTLIGALASTIWTGITGAVTAMVAAMPAALTGAAVAAPIAIVGAAVAGGLAAKDTGTKEGRIAEMGYTPSTWSQVDENGIATDYVNSKGEHHDYLELLDMMKELDKKKALVTPPQAAGKFPEGHKLTGAELAAANASLTAAVSVAPDTPSLTMPNTMIDLEARRTLDQNKIDADNAKFDGATPADQVAILNDIKTLLADLKNINIAQAALQKKTVDATLDIATITPIM